MLEHEVDPDPLRQFRAWLEAAGAAGILLPEATALATTGLDGAPSVRMVLLKGADEQGFAFYTGYESRKGLELAENPRAALCFFWDALGRQVRIEGPVERVAPDESAAYFATRPRPTQLGAWASRQSEVIAGRQELEERLAEATARFADREVSAPPSWGGYRLRPERYEFWEHRDDRLHDRLRYRRAPDGGWTIERLSP